ncbi:hypothetical protein [Rubrivirga sp. IMCC45206]|uniref:hypothetical protein n=1 Tax=Rubrivirga sp. IMCC45206 TaxID=3391614 RepID=UPI0039900E18
MRELADPLRHPSTGAWLVAAGESVRQAVGAAAVTVFGPDDAIHPAASSHPSWAVAAFDGHAAALAAAGCPARALRAGVATRREVYGPAFEALAASPYVREFLPSIGAHDAMTVAAGSADAAVRVVLNADDPGRPFEPEDVAVARLLQPALAAGLLTDRARRAPTSPRSPTRRGHTAWCSTSGATGSTSRRPSTMCWRPSGGATRC